MSAYEQQTPQQVFDRSRERFESVIEVLADPQTGQQTHGELEERLMAESRELMRCLLQDHLDLRAAREEPGAQVMGVDRVVRTRVEKGHSRGLVTVFGPVTVTRMAYRAAGARNVYPADAVLNLPVEKHSHGLRKLAAIESVRGSFEAAGQAIRRATGQGVGKRQVEALARSASVDIDGFYASRRPGPADAGMVLVLTFDGKGIVMRPEALREATAKAAASGVPKLATRLSPGEKRNRKRMAELACVYDAAPAPRAAGDIIACPGTAGQRRRGPVATGTWLTGSVTDDLAAVIADAFDEASRRDPRHQRTWVVLVDGNRDQINAIHAQAQAKGVTVHIVIDIVHVAEYIWGAAWSFFDKGDADAETWVADQLTKILHGKARQVAADIRRRATRFGYSPRERAGADECAKYLTTKAPYLAYDQALEQGWPIATGVIEGACRHLIKDRLDITGARWGLAGAEAILTLRALTSNGDFDAYWTHHLDRERHRVYGPGHRGDYALAA
jgi:hypothetical protein